MGNFFTELSRRNVFRVAAAYVIVGWIVLQVVGLLAPNLGLPAWTVALVFVLLLSAFPIALFLTWAFEMTPEGVKKSERVVQGAASGASRLDIVVIATAILLIVTTILLPPRGPAPADDANTVAMTGSDKVPVFSFAALPLDNLSDDLRLNFIADGMSEDIITRMSAGIWIKVAARNSSFSYRDAARDVTAIARELGVRFILEGSLRVIGEDVRVTVQLIDASTGAHVWADNFDRPLGEFLLNQDAIVTDIVADAGGVLQSVGGASISPDEADDLPLSDQIVMIGDALFSFRFDEAEERLEMVLAKHPDSAIANAQLAFLTAGRNRFASNDPEEVSQEVSDYINKAVRFAPGEPMVLGFVTDALQLNNRYEEGLVYAERAVRLSPYNSYAWNVLTETRLGLGQFEQALKEAQITMTLQGERSSGYRFQEIVAAQALIGLRRFAEAEAFARSSVSRNADFRNLHFLVVALAHQGKLEEARRRAGQLMEVSPYPDVSGLVRDVRIYNRDEAYVETVLEGLALAGIKDEEEGE